MGEKEKRDDGSMENLKNRIANARSKLIQAWEKYGETNEMVLAAAADVDRLINEYMRLGQKQRARKSRPRPAKENSF